MNKELRIAIILGVMCFFLTTAIVIQMNTVSKSTTTVGKTLVENELRDSVSRWKQKYENAVSDFISKMTLEEKIGQMFLVTIGGTEFSDLYYDVENFIAPGGYLLFAYNFVNGEQGINFTSDIENWFGKNDLIKPYFSVDQEGGLVNRLREVASPLPSAHSIAKFLSVDLATTIYDLAAKQLSSLGIHVNLGPVIEILTEENKDFERTIWNEDIEENIFNYIKKTPEFSSCKDKEFSKVEIYLDET